MSESRANGRSSLSARVAEFVKAQPATRRSARARAAVIAQRDEISRAMADGWAVKTIWQTLKADGAVTVGYHAFLRQVAKLIVTAPRASAPKAAEAGLAAPPASPRRLNPTSSPALSAARFEHSAAPQKEEIY